MDAVSPSVLSALFVLVVGLAVTKVPEGPEILRNLASTESWWAKIGFYLALVFWAYQSWYLPRILGSFDFPGQTDPSGPGSGATGKKGLPPRVETWRMRLAERAPRVVGVAPFFCVLLGFWDSQVAVKGPLLVHGLITIVLMGGFAAFVLLRRRVIDRLRQHYHVDDERLPTTLKEWWAVLRSPGASRGSCGCSCRTRAGRPSSGSATACPISPC